MVLTRSARREAGALLLGALPPDATLLVMRFCGPEAVLQLRCAASTFRTLAEDAVLWAEFAAALLRGCPLAITDVSQAGASRNHYSRLLTAARTRFAPLPEQLPVLEIASFGTVGAYSLDVSADGLAVAGGFVDAVSQTRTHVLLARRVAQTVLECCSHCANSNAHPHDAPAQRAEVELSRALGDVRVSIQMPDANGFSHFVYARRAHSYLVWEASAPGTYCLEVQGGVCIVTRPPSGIELEYADSSAPFGVRLALPGTRANPRASPRGVMVDGASPAVRLPATVPLMLGVHLYKMPAVATITRLELLT